jgi:small subunit ribosomal protein S11
MGKKRIVKKTPVETAKGLKKELKIKVTQKIKEGKLYISSSYNNTILTLTDLKGNVILWTSAGHVGFSGTKKGTPYAASKAAELMIDALDKIGVEKLHVLVKGVGAGREAVLRTMVARNVNIVSIKDVTPIPHDGPRPPKVRRV